MLDLQKIYLPKGSQLTENEVEIWRSRVVENTKRFCESSKSHINASFDKFVSDIGFDANVFIAENNCDAFLTPMWGKHLNQINTLFQEKPYNLLNDSLVRYAIYLTCASEFFTRQLPYLKQNYTLEELKFLLKENKGFLPTIVDSEFLTSESRTNHLTHLTEFRKKLALEIDQLPTILEFGGGYGSMTDLLRRINNDATIIVVDFPIMLLVQSYYLLSNYDRSSLNFITSKNAKIVEGKINLCPVNLTENIQLPSVDLFIATWSLSEANEFTHEFVVNKMNLFNAKSILYGYRRYDVPNPRQPKSAPLALKENFNQIIDLPCFWTLDNENNYQFAK